MTDETYVEDIENAEDLTNFEDDDYIDKLASALLEEESPSKEEVEEEVQNEEEVEEENVNEELKPILTDDQLVKVMINGEEKEVTLAELKKGFLRQNDYTKKTQELANEKKQTEAEREQYYIQSFPLLSATAQQNIINAEEFLENPDFLKLAVEDPSEYVAQEAKIKAYIRENKRNLAALTDQYAQYIKEVEQNHYQQLAHGHEILKKAIPGWEDGSVRPVLEKYSTKAGYSLEELKGISDHRHLILLDKARRYDELVSKTKQPSNKVANKSTKTITPGSQTVKPVEEESAAARKKAAIAKAQRGDSEDLIALIAERLM